MELRRYLSIFRRHLVLMIVVIVVALATAYVTSPHTHVYEAQSVLLIGQASIRPDPATNQDQSDPIVAAELAAVTYAKMLTSQTTAALAVQHTGVARSPRQVAEHTTAAQITNTLLVDVTVRDHDPQIAATLATGVSNAFLDEIAQLVPRTADSPAATLYQPAAVPSAPVRLQTARNLEIGGLIGLAIAGALAALIEYLDVTVRGSADAERNLELAVLGAVPLRGATA
jgi:polysaccharide biosynthesis transport protein